MSREVTEFIVAAGAGLEHETIGALAFLVFILITLCVKLYTKSKEKDHNHIDDKIRSLITTMAQLDAKVERQQSSVQSCQNNVISLVNTVKRNENQIRNLKDDAQHSHFHQNAKMLELTDQLSTMSKQMTDLVALLKEDLKVK